jgi:hypothetical protein
VSFWHGLLKIEYEGDPKQKRAPKAPLHLLTCNSGRRGRVSNDDN